MSAAPSVPCSLYKTSPAARFPVELNLNSMATKLHRMRSVGASALLFCMMAVHSVTSVNIEFSNSGSFVIDDMVSSSVFNETSARSDIECAAMCTMRGCAVTIVNDVAGLCQAIVLNNATTAVGPPSTHVRRVVEAAAGDQIRTAADLNNQLITKRFSLSPTNFLVTPPPYTDTMNYRTFQDGAQLSLYCNAGVIYIITCNFGRADSYCGSYYSNAYTACQGQTSCNFLVSFGSDPCPNLIKYAYIVHSCGGVPATSDSGTVQSYVVPVTGCYRIQAKGAQGGTSFRGETGAGVGGNGAIMAGNFSLTAGTQLSIVVGLRGGDASLSGVYSGGGGGGGTFVYVSANNSLLLAAGGGGGGSYYGVTGDPGQNGTSGTGSVPRGASYSGFGGSNGQPGFINTANTLSGSCHGGVGAGWLGMGNMTRLSAYCGDRGGGRTEGWTGGAAGSYNNRAVGGFGGGGGGAAYICGASCNGGASGGGGGFSGGGAGLAQGRAGGGGGSFCGGSGCTGTTGGNTGSQDGSVVIQLISITCF